MTELDKQKMKMRLLETMSNFIEHEVTDYCFTYSSANIELRMSQAAFAVIEQSIESIEQLDIEIEQA